MEQPNVRKSILLVLLVVVSLASGRFFGQWPPHGTVEVRGLELKSLLASVEGIAEEQPRVYKTREGYVRFMIAPPSAYFPVESAKRGTPAKVAGAFLQRWRNLFVSDSSAVGFEIIRVNTQNGRSYLRYRQKYASLEVFGAEMIVQVNSAGGIEAVISDIMRKTDAIDSGKVLLNPVIDALVAQKNAIDWVALRHGQLRFVSSVPALMIFEPGVVGWEGETRLVWHTKVRSVDEVPIYLGLLVDAFSGETAFNYSLIAQAMTPREVREWPSRKPQQQKFGVDFSSKIC